MSNPYQPPESPFGNQPGYPPQPGGDGLAIAALCCGVLALLFSFCCGIFALPLSIAAIITGALGLKAPQRGMAIAGIACGVLALLVAIGMLALGFVLHLNEI